MAMNLRKVMVEMGISDVKQILRIDMDADPQQALEFVKEVLANPITQSAIITFDDEKTSYDQIKDTLIRDRVYIVGEPEYLK